MGKTRYPKAEPKQGLPILPAPIPSQPNYLLQPRGHGRGLGKTTMMVSSRNVHLQLEGAQHLGPSSASPARGLRSHHSDPCRQLQGLHRGGQEGSPLGSLTYLYYKVFPLSHNVKKWLGSPRRRS